MSSKTWRRTQRPPVACWWAKLPKCSRTNKACHPDEESAERHIRALEAEDGPDPRLNAFECDTCGAWHVGRSAAHLAPRPRKGHRRP